MSPVHLPRAAAVALALVLAGCSMAPVRAPATPAFDPIAMVAAIRAAGNAGTELVVTPLGDTAVSDLRALSERQLQAGDVQAAADTLDRALAISPDDPAMLQARAELAVLLRDLDGAAARARAAIDAGSGVGPHCRRHWETLHQVALARAGGDPAAPAAAQARTRRDACTVTPPPRY